MKKIRSLFIMGSVLVLPVVVATSLMFPGLVAAQDNNDNLSIICKIFPFLETLGFGGSGICGGVADAGAQAGTTVAGLIQLVISLIFIAIIGISIYVVIKSALKYIRSEGDETKIQESQKAIKSVFLGIAALFVGVIGIVIVLAIFNVTNNATFECPDIAFVKQVCEALTGATK